MYANLRNPKLGLRNSYSGKSRMNFAIFFVSLHLTSEIFEICGEAYVVKSNVLYLMCVWEYPENVPFVILN